MRNGIDVSGYQHPNNAAIDYQTVAKAGYSWVAVKVNEGAGGVRADLDADCKGFAAADMEVCFYHFARPGSTDPERSGQVFAALCPASPRLARRILDLEDGAQLGWEALAAWTVAFIQEAGVTIVYVNRNYRNNLLPYGFPWGCDVWLANPGATQLPPGFYALQYGQGDVPGIQSTTDLNFVADAPAPAPTPPEDDDMPGPLNEARDASDFIESLYLRIAKAEPDPEGFAYWLELALDGTHTSHDVVVAFAGAVVAKAAGGQP